MVRCNWRSVKVAKQTDTAKGEVSLFFFFEVWFQGRKYDLRFESSTTRNKSQVGMSQVDTSGSIEVNRIVVFDLKLNPRDQRRRIENETLPSRQRILNVRREGSVLLIEEEERKKKVLLSQ